jgi:glycosyltransferase involved in cell wall biosynthesis
VSIADIKSLDFSQFIMLYKFWNSVLNSLCPAFIAKRWVTTPQIRLIIALSTRLKDRLVQIGVDENKVRVIRSGVNSEKFRPQSTVDSDLFKKQMGLPKEDPIIEYFGPLSLFRGVDTAILAMSKIRENFPSAKLVLLARKSSQDGEAARLEEMARRNDITIVSGILREEELIRYLSLADVFVLPFRFWPQVECPLTILEAMSIGKPVVTTTFGAIPEVVIDGENGLTVSPGRPEILAKAVTELLIDRDAALRMGERGRAYTKNFHDWAVIAESTLNVFENVLS